MQNPVAAIRERLQLSQSDLSILANVPSSCISEAESGVRKPPKKLIQFLAEFGHKPQTILAEHAEFVDAKRKAMLENLRNNQEPKHVA